MALTAGLGSSLSVICAGYLSDKLGKKDKRWYIWIAAVPAFVAVPFLLFALFVENSELVVLFLFLFIFSISMYLGPVIAISQSLVGSNIRAMTSAVLFFVLNFIGLGGGPLCIGLISDAIYIFFGIDSMRYALAFVTPIGVIAAIFFLISSHHLLEDLKKCR